MGWAHQTFFNTQRVVGRGELGITGYQPKLMLGKPAWCKNLKQQNFKNNSGLGPI